MTTTDTSGYTGVTASGAGFTGTAPVAVRSSSGPGAYDTVVGDPVDDPPVTSYGVTARHIVFTEGETITARPPSEVRRYAVEWDIGPVSPTVSPESAMDAMRDSPNVVFPFEVVGTRGERTLQLDSTYDLRNVRLPSDSGNPVLVVQSDPTSFTFLTLPGHFRGEGQTIKFVTAERGGRLVLRQEGTSGASVLDWIYDGGAKMLSWRYQADNLRAALYGGERTDFPGPLPVPW